MKDRVLGFEHRVKSYVEKFIESLELNKHFINEKVDPEGILSTKAKINFFLLNYIPNSNKSLTEFSKLSLFKINSLLDEKVSNKVFIKIILKLLVHFMFNIYWFVYIRFLAPRRLQKKFLVKTWIDINYHDYLKTFGKSDELIIVLPFPMSFIRQVKYIVFLMKSNVNFTLSGMNYSKDKIYRFLRFRTWSCLYDLEFEAQKNFALKINKHCSFDQLVTMDDVDPFSLVSNYHIVKCKDNRISTILHGIGTYSPFIFSNHLYVFNLAQSYYYNNWNDIKETTIRHDKNQVDKILSIESINARKIVFYSGVTVSSDLFAIDNEILVIRKLKRFCEVVGVEFIIKLHPNLNGDIFFDYKKIITQTSISFDHVCCSLYSTSYYSIGPDRSFLIDIGVYYLSELFGGNERIIALDELKDFLDEAYSIVN